MIQAQARPPEQLLSVAKGNFILQRSEFTGSPSGNVAGNPPEDLDRKNLPIQWICLVFELSAEPWNACACVVVGKIQIQVPVPRRPCRPSSFF